MNDLSRLDALSRAILGKGWPSLSAWFMETLARFVTSRRRQLVARVGRRGGKSSTLCRFAVAFALAFDARQIPPGDIGIVAFISTTRDEANQRLRTIKAILDAIGIAWRPIEGGVELCDRPIGFKVFSATIAGVSGFTAILIICDEVAKWRDADTGANPATEVLASVRPTMATQPDARIILSSSPLGNDDAHAKSFDAGETNFQIVAHAPTWIANPTVSEAETRALEPDERVWLREYAAIPQTAKLAAFVAEHIARAFDVPDEVGSAGVRVGIIDASSVRKDAFTFGICGWRMIDGCKRLAFDVISGFDARGARRLGVDDAQKSEVIVSQICGEGSRFGVKRFVGDQRESFTLSGLFARNGMRFESLAWTSASKEAATTAVRRWLADDLLVLPNHETMRRELIAFEEKITPSGSLTFGARGSGHDDYVALLLTAAMAEQAGLLHGSPHRRASITQAILAAQERGHDPVAAVARGFGLDMSALQDFGDLRRLAR